MVIRRWIAALVVAVIGFGLPMLGMAYAGNVGQSDCRSFPETGKRVCGRFLAYWQEHGGLAQQGFPISNEFREVSEVDGKEYTVQYFERAQFELHPENAPPHDVLLSLLGSLRYKEKYPNGSQSQELPPSKMLGPERVFPETDHTIRGPFREYWEGHGGLAQQGFPISQPLLERSDRDGKEYVMQYFERAVFELHPENAPPHNVLLSHLGRLRFERKYPGDEPGTASPTPTPAPDAWAALRARPLKLPTVGPTGGCPASQGKIVNEGFGPALGNGPLYPVGLGVEGTMYTGGALEEGGWLLMKVLWIAAPQFEGPALVRGGRIDGAGELRFGEGPKPSNELRLQADKATPAQWRDWPGYTRLRGPGCYAYQVDGANFSIVIPFRAVDSTHP